VTDILSIDPLSGISCRLQLRCKSQKIGEATGMLWRRNNKTYLVSNWHVFSGRNTYTGQLLVPNSLAFPESVFFEIAIQTISDGVRFFQFEYPLFDNQNSLWIMDPKKGQDIDVAALDITNSSLGDQFLALGDQFENSPIDVGVGDDVFIIGYPRGLHKQQGFPIWKRGSIATEFQLAVDDLPIFLVDSATREGMSGSPVYAVRKGSFLSPDGTQSFITGHARKFLGVYSGRYGADDEMSAQVGRVWHAFLVNNILDHGVVGDYKIR
jgi:hypothetical protein